MNRHEPKHVHCEHVLKVCDHCDVAYCKKCDKEWGAPCTLSHYPYWTWTYPSSPTVIAPHWWQSTGSVTTVAHADSVLDRVWNNHEDCVYDTL